MFSPSFLVARALGAIMRRIILAPCPGSAAESGFTVAGFNVEKLR